MYTHTHIHYKSTISTRQPQHQKVIFFFSLLYSKKTVSVKMKEIEELGSSSRVLKEKMGIDGGILVLNRRELRREFNGGKVPLKMEQVKRAHIYLWYPITTFLRTSF